LLFHIFVICSLLCTFPLSLAPPLALFYQPTDSSWYVATDLAPSKHHEPRPLTSLLAPTNSNVGSVSNISYHDDDQPSSRDEG
jgi:hypothetical protein